MVRVLNRIIKILNFYMLKLPFVYIMIPIGFVFEFLTTFPFAVMVSIDGFRRKNR